jgi:D-alanyl-D-alanine carboxypeptidase (penicillin-binding protein 5/6)
VERTVGFRSASRRGRFIVPIAALFGFLLVGLAACGRQAPPPVEPIPDAPQFIFAGRPLELSPLPCVSALLLEPVSNQVLYDQNSYLRRAPASIAKLTLELVVMHEIEAGRLALTDSIRVSGWASNIGGSQAYLAENEVFPLEKMMKAIVVHSANDACAAVAEHIAGTTDGFVRLMNQEAEALKLENTHYVNVHGLDDEPGAGNVTTAADIAQIARALIRFPHILEWSSIEKEYFREPSGDNAGFLLENTNRLLGQFSGLDGLKTGFTAKAGFCLCATAERNGFRLISVILGAASNRDRVKESASLLAAGFNAYTPVKVAKKGDLIGESVPVKGGRVKSLRGVAPYDLTVVLSRPDDRRVEKKIVSTPNLQAPIRAGQPIGKLEVSSGGTLVADMPIVAAQDVARSGFFRRLFGG